MGIVVGYNMTSLVGIGVGVALVAIVVKRYFFHPLSKYPGRFFDAVSSVPVAISLVSGRNHAFIKKLHDTYGPVVRVSPNELSFCGSQAWEDIHGFHADEPMEKDPIWVGALHTTNGEMPMPYAPREVHARQRRAFSHSLSNTSVMQQEPLVQNHIQILVQRLGELEADGKPVNMRDWFCFYTLDVISDLYVGTPFGCLTEPGGRKWLEALEQGMQCGVYEQATRRIAGCQTKLQRLLYNLFIPSYLKAGKLTFFLKSKQKVLERLQDADRDHKDFMYYILRNNEAKNLLSPTEILLNSSTFIAAGGDTTASALAGITYSLLTHPADFSRLKSEIRNRCPTAESITHSHIKDLPFLNAVIHEGLRFYTPVVIGSLRQVSPNGKGAMIDEHYVPPGTTVSIPQWTVTHSELNFTRPNEFLPERWLNPEKFPGDKLSAAQPFGIGPRGCIGKNLSWMEMRLVLCSVFWAFDMELEGGREGAWRWEIEGDVKNLKAYMMFQRPDLWVRLRRVVR